MGSKLAPQITSAHNEKVKWVRSLAKGKSRDEARMMVLEGARLVEDAVLSGASIKEVFMTVEFASAPAGEAILSRADALGIRCTLVSDKVLDVMAQTENPQGVVAVAGYVDRPLAEVIGSAGGLSAEAGKGADPAGIRPPFLLTIAGVQDPGNLGTMLRSAAAAGATGVVVTRGSCDVYNPKALRASMGSVFRIPVARGVCFEEAVDMLRARGIRVIGTWAGSGTVYYEADYTSPCALVIGNEARGLSQREKAACDLGVEIPMHNGVESLNAAVAASVTLFEAARQRQGRS